MKLRRADKVPAVVYGPKEQPQAITLDGREFEKAFKEAGESAILVLAGDGGNKEVLIHDVAFDPLRGNISHVDFYAVEKGQKVTVHIPLSFVGEAPALKLGGLLTKALHEIEVTGEPSKLPHEIEVDISGLNSFEDEIRVKDLAVPKGVEINNDPEDMVAIVAEVKEEAEEAPALDMEAIEVEAKGKERTEEEAS